MRFVLALALALTATAPLATAHPAPTAAPAPQVGKDGFHENNRYGFKFKAPKDWRNIAVKTDEAWLAAKYLSDKTYYFTDPLTKYTSEQTPEMLVIAFIRENMERTREVEESEEDGVVTKTIKINNPYKSYEDFLDRTYSGGGFYIDEKEKKKVGDLDVTMYTVKVEKLSRQGPKRILCWMYHTDDIDYAMQVEVLEGEYQKLQRTIERSFKSFAEIPRTEDYLPTDGRTDTDFFITIREMNEGTPKERRSKRMESQEQLHERAIRRLPEDWDHLKAGDVLVLSHTDKKYAKRVGDHAVLLIKWLEKTFPYIGKGEYVRAPIIRVCKDQEEEASYGRGVNTGGSWWFGSGNEITTHKDDSGFIGWEMDWVNGRLFDAWFNDRDRDLAYALPEWLDNGLDAYVAGARASGRKLDFRVDDMDRDNARLAVAQGKATSPKDLIRMTREEYVNQATGTAEQYWNRRAESAMLVRFLMSREGRRCRQSKDLIENYMLALKEVVEEQKKLDTTSFKETDAPKTEEEEEEQAKARAERWRAKEKAIMEKVFEKVFGEFDDSDWAAFEKAYFDFIG